jgi:hypothetical protein
MTPITIIIIIIIIITGSLSDQFGSGTGMELQEEN